MFKNRIDKYLVRADNSIHVPCIWTLDTPMDSLSTVIKTVPGMAIVLNIVKYYEILLNIVKLVQYYYRGHSDLQPSQAQRSRQHASFSGRAASAVESRKSKAHSPPAQR